MGRAATGDAGDDDDIEYGNAALGKCSNLMSAVMNQCGSYTGTPAEQIAEGIIKALAGEYDCSLPPGGSLDAAVEKVGSMLTTCFDGGNDGSKCDGPTLIANLGDAFVQISSVIQTCQEQVTRNTQAYALRKRWTPFDRYLTHPAAPHQPKTSARIYLGRNWRRI
jgi:hypothetical protein